VRPAFSGHSLATAIFTASLLVWLVIEVRQGLRRRPGATNTDRGSLNLLRLVSVGAALLAALALRISAAGFGYSPVAMGLSIGLIWGGLGLRWWSFQTLGRYFTFQVMTSQDQPVIMTGPYRFVRHPSYTALLLILAGIGLSYGNWLSLAALTVVPLLGFMNRIRVEEAALATALGDRYTTYARGRKRLVPFVW
jgi:protein-S-isoprenylcysteine O-methyltransferase Ste14